MKNIIYFFQFIFISLFYFFRKKKVNSYKNESRIHTHKSNFSDFQSNETAFDLSKIDLSLDKNSIEIANVNGYACMWRLLDLLLPRAFFYLLMVPLFSFSQPLLYLSQLPK